MGLAWTGLICSPHSDVPALKKLILLTIIKTRADNCHNLPGHPAGKFEIQKNSQ